MAEERKPKMSIAELEAALADLPEAELDELIDRVVSQRAGIDEIIHPVELGGAHPRPAGLEPGRVKPVAFDQVTDGLEVPTVSGLEAAAMQIEVDGRAELADRLISSVLGRDSYDPEWVATVMRRMDEIDSGRASTLSEEEFFARLSARRHARSVS